MKAHAPGKLILSGEHAVVHGAPALAIAVNRYATATVTKSHLPSISFDFANMTHKSQLSIKALKAIKQRIKEKYKRFVVGDYRIRDVLQKPFELAQFAMGLFTDSLNLSLPHGVKVSVTSDIPVGCGMGSSAATILSVMHAFSAYLDAPVSQNKLYKLALEAENMQHGFSSGLDLRVAMQGGCVYVENEIVEARAIGDLPLYLVNTGVPRSTTGECVAAVRPHFENTNLRDQFAGVTKAMDQAVQSNHFAEFKNQIRHNHQLLTEIGVVPLKVQEFIHDVEKAMGAAKICGAGAVSGDRAGAMLAVLDDADMLAALARKRGYTISAIDIDKRGAHAI